MEERIDNLWELKRNINAVEHMIYVSCKYTKTTEMIRKVMETIVSTYEKFFTVAYSMLVEEEGDDLAMSGMPSIHHKIERLNEVLASRGVYVDLSDYFLLKKLLMAEFDCVGEYRKNLCMVAYIDGEEYSINISKLLEFYNNLKYVYDGVTKTI